MLPNLLYLPKQICLVSMRQSFDSFFEEPQSSMYAGFNYASAQRIQAEENTETQRRSQRQSKPIDHALVDHSSVTRNRNKKTKAIKKSEKLGEKKHADKTGRPINSDEQKQFLRQLAKIKNVLYYEVETSLQFQEFCSNIKQFTRQFTIKVKPQFRSVLQNAQKYLLQDNFPEYRPQGKEEIDIQQFYLETSMLGLVKNYKDKFLKSKKLKKINYEALVLLFKIFLRCHSHLNMESVEFLEKNQQYILNLLKMSGRVVRSSSVDDICDNLEQMGKIQKDFEVQKQIKVSNIQNIYQVQQKSQRQVPYELQQIDFFFFSNQYPFQGDLQHFLQSNYQRQQRLSFAQEQIFEEDRRQNYEISKIEQSEQIEKQQQFLTVDASFKVSKYNTLANTVGNYFYFILQAMELKVCSSGNQ